METKLYVVSDDSGVVHFATTPELLDEVMTNYCQLFGVDPNRLYSEVFPVPGDSTQRLWCVRDDNGTPRFLEFGTSESLQRSMTKYVAKFGNPTGCFVSTGYIHQFYKLDDYSVSQALSALPIPVKL